MIKLTVLYGFPDSPADFEDYYARVHEPLAAAIPGVVRTETSLTMPRADGTPPPYYRVAELWFPDLETFGAAMASEQGKAAGADVVNFATGGSTMVVSAVDEH